MPPPQGLKRGGPGGVWGKESRLTEYLNPTPFTLPERTFLPSFILYSGAVTPFPYLEAHAETAEKMAAE